MGPTSQARFRCSTMDPSSKKRRKPLSQRWLEFCDRVAFSMVSERDLPPALEGVRLVVAAMAMKVRRLLVPQRLTDAMKRRASERVVEVETKGLARVIDFWEYLVGSLVSRVRSVGAWWLKLLVPSRQIKSAEKAVEEKSAALYRRAARKLQSVVQAITPLWLRRALQRYSRPFTPVYNFGVAWTKSRSWKKLLWAIPVAVFAMPLLGAIAASVVYSPDAVVRRYEKSLMTALEEKDEQAQQVCLQKLNQLGYRRMERAEFASALKLASQEGKWEDAVEQMRALAPLEDGGNAEAHLWLGEQLLVGKLTPPDRFERLEKHAQHALNNTSEREFASHSRAKYLTAFVLDRKGQRDEAKALMGELSEVNETLHFGLFQTALQERDFESARRHGRKVILFCERRVKEDAPESALTAPQHHSWTLATELLEGRDAALEIAATGFHAFPENQVLRQQYELFLADNLGAADSTSVATLEALRELNRVNPSNASANQFLGNLAILNPEKAKQVASTLSAEASIAVTACLGMGDQRWSQNDPHGALWFYQLATSIDPQSVAAWNNVAWLLGCVEATEDLDLALEAANRAVAIEQDARCFETRGQIFAKRKDWNAAILDLERAVNGSLPDSRPAHETLAMAFEALGDEEAASAHRRKAGIRK